MRDITKLTLLLISMICVTGCYTKRPELRGTVVNVWTDAPIANATVTVAKDALGNPPATVTTDAKGEFIVKRETGFGGLKKGRWTYPVDVAASGFAGSSVDVVTSSRKQIDRIEGLRFELVQTQTSPRGQ